jgi:hypothetical protein
MALIGYWKKAVAAACAGLLLVATAAPAQAAMVGTEQVLADARVETQRAELVQMIERDEVRQQLEAMGVDPAHAKERVQRMTQSELAQLHGRMNEAAAGGDALGVALVVFIVFVITDVIGATDIFPFIHPVE